MKPTPVLAVPILLSLVLCGCGVFGSREPFTIVSGSQNRTFEPLVQEFADHEGVTIEITYMGSVEMMLEMDDDEFPYDAVWPANSLWISLGDSRRRIKHIRSIARSPVVFGLRRDIAEELGFVDTEVAVADILAAIRAGEFQFMMGSASQSDSGAGAYLSFLYAFAGNPDVLTIDHLRDPQLIADIQDLLGGIHRSAGSSGWLKDLFVQSDYDAMVNHEAMIIEANQELTERGREPLYAIYPVDGIVVSDTPLGYVNREDAKKEEFFIRLQEFLLSQDVQARLSRYGRRTGSIGRTVELDQAVFAPEWGIETERMLAPIRMPSSEVIYEALRLYQSEFRKPSFTVFALDFSGSMVGGGEEQLKEAMRLLLDQSEARQYLLQAGEEDITIVLPFANEVLTAWQVVGYDPDQLLQLSESIGALEPDGGTNIYAPAIMGLDHMAQERDISDYIPAIILMTDGEHTATSTFEQLASEYQQVGIDVPVFAIMFGSALESELDRIVRLTGARLFDGREDLIQAFRTVKGYN